MAQTDEITRNMLFCSRKEQTPLFSFPNNPFIERLQHCTGNPWTVFEAQQHLDALVLQPPHPLSPDAPSFIDFLEKTFHRRLLHCFVGGNVGYHWTVEDLMKQTQPPSLMMLIEALEQCCFWQIAVSDGETNTWHGHARMVSLNNLGWTFEWVIQALLERDYNALVRRHVILGEIATLGEIDILALLPNGQSLLVECKSSSKGLTDRQLDGFVAKTRGFPADRALLLIDTDDPHRMQQRMGQFELTMQRTFGNSSIGAIQLYGGTSVVHLQDNLFVADTGGGIIATLQAVLSGPFESL